MFVGRVEAAKGIFYLIEAFSKLKDYDVQLTIVGGIDTKDKQILKDISENNNIIYEGIKQKSEMNRVYQEADVYIMASLFEGFSLSLFEAMASGIPIIATRNSVADGIIQNYKEGFVIDAASTEDIKEKIIWFYENKDKISTMGKEARKLSEKYTWENYKYNLINQINKV